MSSVTFWYTGDELERSDGDGLHSLISWCHKEIKYQVGDREIPTTSPRFEVIELLDQTIDECQRILETRRA